MNRKYVFGFILIIIPIYIYKTLHGFIIYKGNRILFDVLFSQRFRIGFTNNICIISHGFILLLYTSVKLLAADCLGHKEVIANVTLLLMTVSKGDEFRQQIKHTHTKIHMSWGTQIISKSHVKFMTQDL